jgi:hypothetical protein
MSQDWKVGEVTKYGPIVDKGGELLPEFVYHLPMQTFVYMKPGEPLGFRIFVTEDDKWNGKPKFHWFEFLTNSAPYLMHALVQMVLAKDGTVGTIGPLTCVLEDGSVLVAVDPHKIRHNSGPYGLVEAFRQRVGSKEVKIEVTGGKYTVEQYKSDKLGLTLIDSAKEIGPQGRLAYVNCELTLLRAKELPQLNAKFEWIEAEKYLFTLDGPSKGVVTLAIALKILPALNDAKIRRYQSELPALIDSVRLPDGYELEGYVVE